MSARPASDQLHSNPSPRPLRSIDAFSRMSTSNIRLPDAAPTVVEASKTSMDSIRQSNRKMVIINEVLYQPVLLSNPETSSTVDISRRSKLSKRRRKLQKKSLLYQDIAAMGPEIRLQFPLPSDYLQGVCASREATLLHVSKLLASRSNARHTQTGGNIRAISNTGPRARSADMCPALSSHPVVVPEIVITAPGQDVSTVDTGHNPTAVGRAESSLGGKLGCTQKRRVKFEENVESTSEKCKRLEQERDIASEKCKGLEQELDNAYKKCGSLEQELEITTGMREPLEKIVAELQQQIRDLPTEAAAQNRNGAEIHHSRREGRCVQAEIAEQSCNLSQTEADQESRGRAVARVIQSPQTDRYEIYKGSPPDKVDADSQTQKKDFSSMLYDDGNGLPENTHCELQNKVETSQERPHDMQIRSGLPINSLIESSFSKLPPLKIIPQAKLELLENGLARHQPQSQIHVHAHELGAMVSKEALRQQTDSTDVDPAIDQLPEFLPTSSQSHPPQKIDGLSVELSSTLQTTQNGAEPESPWLAPSPPPHQSSLRNPDASLGDDDTENNQPNTYTIFRFGSRRIQEVPAVHRVRISTKETEQSNDEHCLIPHLNTWEWSSVPDLQLRDPTCEN